MTAQEAISRAARRTTAVPAFNIPYLPMARPVAEAVRGENSVAMLQVARVEWLQFQAESMRAVRDAYLKVADPAHTLLHLDHIPVIDEELSRVDYLPLIEEGIALGYQSVMIDGSRLPLEENIRVSAEVARAAHAAGIPCEAELGAVLGHESTVLPPYETIFATRQGFTVIEEAARFARESGCDWLSVAVGNIHGAVALAVRHQKKPLARLDIAHVRALREATGLPLVLHGGSGIEQRYILEGIEAGIAKINVGTEIRQAYEQSLAAGGEVERAQEAVYERTRSLLRDFFHISGSAKLIGG